MPSAGPFDVVRATGAALGDGVRAWLMRALTEERGGLVGLAVGDSTLPLYGALPEDPAWNAVRILPIDELVPPPADPEAAFHARLRRALPSPLAARTDALPPEPGAIDALVGDAGLRAIVLGLGPDGHVAFNQPGTTADSRAATVALAEANRARLGDVAPATHALTMGVATILAAARIALVVAGPGKEAALARVLDGPVADDVPATLLRNHPALTVFVGTGA